MPEYLFKELIASINYTALNIKSICPDGWNISILNNFLRVNLGNNCYCPVTQSFSEEQVPKYDRFI